MSKTLEIAVPDIGDFDEVEVVELLVAKGDEVAFDDPLVSVESDKATMEIPSTSAGTVVEVRVSEGDRVSEGSVLVLLELAAESPSPNTPAPPPAAPVPDPLNVSPQPPAPTPSTPPSTPPPPPASPVSEGPTVAESAPAVSSGNVRSTSPPPPRERPAKDGPDLVPTEALSVLAAPPRREMSRAAANPVPDRKIGSHASPLVRRYARELGVPVESAEGTGPHGRLLVDDLKRHVRDRFQEDHAPAGAAGGIAGPSGTGFGIPAMPSVDHGAFGPVREEPLTRIQKVSGPGLHRSWLNVPHVTQYDESDVTELEGFRKARRSDAEARGVKLSPLLFVMKAVVRVLEEFPTFRSSLAAEGDRLIVKDYFHLGIAVDTDQGLVVPVIRDVDRKGIFELAEEVSETAERARARKLRPDDLRGACFTISSLGGIGGSGFSPIVNAPEVAILGLSKTRVQPVWNGPSPVDQALSEASGDETEPEPGAFEPRLIMPFSLSYDHRVIDGANAVRFTTRLARVLGDPMQLLL